MMRECKATGKLIINPAKAGLSSSFNHLRATEESHPLKRGAKLISLDNYYTQEYNNEYEICETQFNHHLSGLKIKPQGANLWRTPQRIISNLYKQKMLNKIKFKIFFILIGFINQALANPIDTMDKNITKLNEFHTQQNQNYEKYIKVKINTLTDISQSIFLLKQNNELLLIEHKMGAINGQ